ncbi:MAG: diguanylate cyclase [Oscillospiraceae bacterium]|nr:diguanylate cyclase [Oscillospiraceae bacterium]
MKVKTMIMVAAICFAIIPMIAFGVLTNMMVRSDGDTMYVQELNNMASAQVNTLNALQTKVQSDLNTIAAFPAISEYGKTGTFADNGDATANDAIKRYVTDNPVIGSVALVNSSGKIAAGENKGTDYPGFVQYLEYNDETLYFDEVANAAGNGASMFIKKKLGQATLFISYNLGSDNSILARFTSAVSFYSQGNIIVIDSRSVWSSGVTMNTNLQEMYSADVASKVSTLSANGNSGLFEFDGVDGNTKGVLVKADGDGGLAALVYCPSNRNGFYSSKSFTPIVTFGILLAVVSVVAAIMSSKMITKPLGSIEATLSKILRGDHEARIGAISTNEYGQMSRAFNNIVDEIVVSEDRYKVISDMSDNIIFEWNFRTNEVMFSANFNKKFSYRPPSDHFGDSFLMKAKLHPEDADRYRSDLDRLEKGTNFENNEYRILNIYGDYIWILIRTATLKDADGKPLKAVGVMVDIDRAKKSEAKLTAQASYDALTELYNRETIESQIDNEIQLSEMRQAEMAVLFIDVDDFKHYNDDYSHATGDQVLKFLAKTIKEAVDGIGFAGRYGGDEFIAMVRNTETNDPAVISQKLIDRLAEGFDADIGERLGVSVSIGIAVIKDDYNTRVEYLIGKADDAMYSVKKSGKSNYAFI